MSLLFFAIPILKAVRILAFQRCGVPEPLSPCKSKYVKAFRVITWRHRFGAAQTPKGNRMGWGNGREAPARLSNRAVSCAADQRRWGTSPVIRAERALNLCEDSSSARRIVSGWESDPGHPACWLRQAASIPCKPLHRQIFMSDAYQEWSGRLRMLLLLAVSLPATVAAGTPNCCSPLGWGSRLHYPALHIFFTF